MPIVTTEAVDGFVVDGEHIELGVGVIEHLLVARAVAAEAGAVAGELAAGHQRAFHTAPPLGLGPVPGDDGVDLLRILQETKVAGMPYDARVYQYDNSAPT